MTMKSYSSFVNFLIFGSQDMTMLYLNPDYNKQCNISFSLLVFLCPHVLSLQPSLAQKQNFSLYILYYIPSIECQ